MPKSRKEIIADLEKELVEASRRNDWRTVARIQETFGALNDPEFQANVTRSRAAFHKGDGEQHIAGPGPGAAIVAACVIVIVLSFVVR